MGKVSQGSQIAKNTVSEDDEVIKDEPEASNFLRSIYKTDEDGLAHQRSIKTMLEKNE